MKKEYNQGVIDGYVMAMIDISNTLMVSPELDHLCPSLEVRFKTQDAILEDLKKRKESSLKKYQPKENLL